MKKNQGIGLDGTAASRVVASLQALLADETVLAAKTRAAHWNVTGPHFAPLHALFGEQYDAIDGNLDDIAERIRALGAFPVSTLKGQLAIARLSEPRDVATGAEENLAALLADHEALARRLRSDVAAADEAGDAGTADFLTGLLEGHEKTAWMLRASLGR